MTLAASPCRAVVFGLDRPAYGPVSGRLEGVLEQNPGRWLTYAEAGALLGISPGAVRQLARRRGWQRRTPSAYGGHASILVPEEALVQSRPGSAPYVRGYVLQRCPPGRPPG